MRNTCLKVSLSPASVSTERDTGGRAKKLSDTYKKIGQDQPKAVHKGFSDRGNADLMADCSVKTDSAAYGKAARGILASKVCNI